jgi:seryl-tRNA synthetase
MPGRDAYGEITSTSNTTDYQARRLQIRYRKNGGRPQLLHTLNGTAIAVSRALIRSWKIISKRTAPSAYPRPLSLTQVRRCWSPLGSADAILSTT